MASKLSSILVKQGLLPIRKLDQAFQIQVLKGGTLDTSLFEMNLFKERDLIHQLVEATGIPTLNLRSLNIEKPIVLRNIFPPRLAQRHKVIPVIKNKDRVGVLVTVEFDKTKLEEMGFMLGITLFPRVVPEVRLWEIANKIYGFPLDERIEAILEKLGPVITYPGNISQDWENDVLSENTSETQNTAKTEQPEKIEEKETEPFEEAIPTEDKTPIPDFEYVERKVSSNALLPVIQNSKFDDDFIHQTKDEDFFDATTKPGFVPDGSLSDENVRQYLHSPDFKDDYPEKSEDQILTEKDIQTEKSEDQILTEKDIQTENQQKQFLADVNDDLTQPISSVEMAEIIKDSEVPPEERETVSIKPQPEKINPEAYQTPEDHDGNIVSFDSSSLDFDKMAKFLEQADNKDDILITFLRFAAHFCDFSYIFTITQNAAKGRFAMFGSQLDQHSVRDYFISLEFPSFLEKSYKNIPVYGEFEQTEGNVFIKDYLNLANPSHIISVPVTIGQKTVAVFTGFRNRPFETTKIFTDIIAGAALTSQALLRILKEKKKEKLNSQKSLNIVKKPAITINSTNESITDEYKETVGVPAPAQQTSPEITAKMPSSVSIEKVIALLDKLEHMTYQQGKLDMSSATELMNNKDKTLEVLMFYFPGMITVDENNIKNIPEVSKTGPLMQFIVQWGLPVVPVLLNLFDSPTPKVRFYAIYAFSEIRFPQILLRIAEKLQDMDEKVRIIAAKVILSYEGHNEVNQILRNLISSLSTQQDFAQINNVEALGRIPNKNSVLPLINLLEKLPHHDKLSDSVVKALQNITLKNFDSDPARWNAWWTLNNHRHRILWLIEGLRDENLELRHKAIRELTRLVGTDMDYDPSAPVKVRENSIRNWISWWDRQGKRIFTE